MTKLLVNYKQMISDAETAIIKIQQAISITKSSEERQELYSKLYAAEAFLDIKKRETNSW